MKRMNLKIIATAAVAFFAVALVGCESQPPMTPASTNKVVKKASEFKKLRVKNPSLQKAFIDSALITPAQGGVVEVGNWWHGISDIRFKPGDVSQPVMVVFEWESTGFLEGGAEFSPHGTTFNKPVKIELSYKDADLTGVNENDLKIWYYNENDDVWELIGDDVNTWTKTVTGWTTHFSRYAIGGD